MKRTIYLLITFFSVILLYGCHDDIVIDGRTNADVTITNETTGETWHGNSDGIVQEVTVTIGETEEENSYDIAVHEGDILCVNYSPYPHFAEEHMVSMSVKYFNKETVKIEHSPYEAKYTIGADIPKGIGIVTVVGTSGNKGDDCYLYESRAVKVKVE